MTVAGRPRWPLLLIGASAGTATWSGWVGLGGLVGFGVVHPLPGTPLASWTVDTAITLPVGVEAYAVYALSVATDARPLPARTRRYAWFSAAAALALGMAGQVAYHLMTHSTRRVTGEITRTAPWQVVALVSCLPVLVLGAASLLWHLAGQSSPVPEARPEEAPARRVRSTKVHPSPAPAAEVQARDVPGAPSAPDGPGPGDGARAATHPTAAVQVRPSKPGPAATQDDAALVAAVARTTPLPSARQIKATYRVGQARAARIHAAAERLTHSDNQPEQATEEEDPTATPMSNATPPLETTEPSEKAAPQHEIQHTEPPMINSIQRESHDAQQEMTPMQLRCPRPIQDHPGLAMISNSRRPTSHCSNSKELI
jgi:hypothetical protein